MNKSIKKWKKGVGIKVKRKRNLDGDIKKWYQKDIKNAFIKAFCVCALGGPSSPIYGCIRTNGQIRPGWRF